MGPLPPGLEEGGACRPDPHPLPTDPRHPRRSPQGGVRPGGEGRAGGLGLRSRCCPVTLGRLVFPLYRPLACEGVSGVLVKKFARKEMRSTVVSDVSRTLE